MAKDTTNLESRGQGMTRSFQRQESGYPLGLVLTPRDLFRMNPFSLMRRMITEMDSAFGETASSRGEEATAVWAPVIEVSQREGTYVIRAELPGIDSKDVKLEVTDEAVVLQGERKIEREEDKRDIHLSERVYGTFYRAIPLPEGAKVEDVRARFENGVLEVTVPVQEQRSNRREVQIEGASSAGQKTTPTEKAA